MPPVVIMAGGKGTRLLPLTERIPKPMALVNDAPILEWIIKRFVTQGFREFYLAVNHLAHVIEDHFGDGTGFACTIHYLRESNSLGTAGALSLLPDAIKQPFIVSNGDVLASVNYADMLRYHESRKAIATIGAHTHRVEIPYGVLAVDQTYSLQTINEKPTYEYPVSAGIYVLAPSVLNYIPYGTALDMPDLIDALTEDGQKVSVFPISGDWMDIARPADLQRANAQNPPHPKT